MVSPITDEGRMLHTLLFPCLLHETSQNHTHISDSLGSGYLFFEYVRVLKYLDEKSQRKGKKLYWLFENTAAMESKTLQEMSRYPNLLEVLSCHLSAVIGLTQQ